MPTDEPDAIEQFLTPQEFELFKGAMSLAGEMVQEEDEQLQMIGRIMAGLGAIVMKQCIERELDGSR